MQSRHEEEVANFGAKELLTECEDGAGVRSEERRAKGEAAGEHGQAGGRQAGRHRQAGRQGGRQRQRSSRRT